MTNKVKLGEIATYINGYAFKPSDWDTTGREIIRIQNLTKSSQEVNYYNAEIDSKYIVNSGDILISWSATLGVYEWTGEQAVLNQHIFKVVFDKKEVNKTYFKYVVKDALQNSHKHSHGSTMKHLTKRVFDNLLVSLPDIKIQDKVANKLQAIDSVITSRNKQLEGLDNLVKSRYCDELEVA